MRPKSSGWIAFVLVCCACEGLREQCITPPCALPLAVTLPLTSAATGDSVTGATVRVIGPVVGTAPCPGSTCDVLGPAGTYTLTVEAPGFQTAERTVTVRGAAPSRCGCGSTITERLDLALVPAL